MITGNTRIFFMLADPIHHVRTPEVLNPLFRARGIDAVMVPVHHAPADFAAAWQAMKRMRNLGGMVVSVPLKEQALELADRVGAEAQELGAANTVRREADGTMVAENFDGRGFLQGLLGGGADAQGREALLLGAGGAGRAIAFGLARSGVASLRVHDPDAARAQSLADRIAAGYPQLRVSAGPNDLDGVDLLVNASPCGLHPETDPAPVDLSRLRPEILVADIIMKPRETPLLRAAQDKGCQVRHGAPMLDCQLELMLEFFGL
ncbi:shikimate dehydrogenase [Paracoccus sp. FO-3]|uniref:shikimate dehydrogenase family protein n=1 Tax=Paracoccus sp. FO-3 TaxID=1335059 RepID=UPI00112D314B|nr:shikimate dehydrogenase [Paracoccus sp. FO-3]